MSTVDTSRPSGTPWSGPADLGFASVVVTFDPHPSEVVRPGSHPAILTESARKAELIEALGVDVLCVIPFTLEFSHLSAETFVHDVLVEHLHAAVVVVGENFRFGHKAAGDVPLLAQLGRTFGFTVEGAPLVSATPRRPCSRRPTSAAAWTPATSRRRPGRSAGRTGSRASWCAATSAAGRSASRPRTCSPPPHAAIPADGVYAAYVPAAAAAAATG